MRVAGRKKCRGSRKDRKGAKTQRAHLPRASCFLLRSSQPRTSLEQGRKETLYCEVETLLATVSAAH